MIEGIPIPTFTGNQDNSYFKLIPVALVTSTFLLTNLSFFFPNFSSKTKKAFFFFQRLFFPQYKFRKLYWQIRDFPGNLKRYNK